MWDPSLASPPPVAESPEPTPSADPPPDAPTPRISAGCDDLVPLDILKTTLTDDVAFDPERSRARSPEDAALEQLGALTCLWANGAPQAPWDDPDPDYTEAVLHIVPDAESSWARFAAIYGKLADPSPYGENAIGPSCRGAEEDVAPFVSHDCDLEALVGAYWVRLSLRGVLGNAAQSNEEMSTAARDITDPLMEKLSTEDPPAPPWTPPPSSMLDCEWLLTGAQAASLTGVEDLTVGQFLDGPKVGQFVHGLETTGAKRCHIMIAGTDVSLGQISFLPAGAWAFRERSDSWISTGGAVPIELDGAGEDEQFTEECTSAEKDCRIDMLVADDWYQVLTYAYVPEKMSTLEGIDMLEVRSKTRAIAETVLANLHARGKTS
ncbi:MAG TPA: hypothetical protein VEX88_06800 [Glaciibacter sp.]|nr:hypothetical protein [Glaciibacter sp.]